MPSGSIQASSVTNWRPSRPLSKPMISPIVNPSGTIAPTTASQAATRRPIVADRNASASGQKSRIERFIAPSAPRQQEVEAERRQPEQQQRRVVAQAARLD